VFRKSLQFYNDNSNQCSRRRFNGLFWIAFDFPPLSRFPHCHHRSELLSIRHDYLIKKVFHFLFFGTQINARFFPIRLSFFNYCLLTNRTKQKFVIKFCAVAKREEKTEIKMGIDSREKLEGWRKHLVRFAPKGSFFGGTLGGLDDSAVAWIVEMKSFARIVLLWIFLPSILFRCFDHVAS
jgi:hypothetical protein